MMPRRKPNKQAGTELAKADDAVQPTSIETLRRTLARYSALAEEAWRQRNAGAFRAWSAAAERVAGLLLPFEEARKSPVETIPAASGPVRFPLSIFDSARKPLSLELVAAPPPSDAGASESTAAASRPAGETSTPEADSPPPGRANGKLASEVLPPEAPSPEANGNGRDDSLAWVRMNYYRTVFGGGRGPRGSWHGN
jgi:hypothetical protein